MLNAENIDPPVITMRDIYDLKVQEARQGHCGSWTLTAFVFSLFLGTAMLTGVLMWPVLIQVQVSQSPDQESQAQTVLQVSR